MLRVPLRSRGGPVGATLLTLLGAAAGCSLVVDSAGLTGGRADAGLDATTDGDAATEHDATADTSSPIDAPVDAGTDAPPAVLGYADTVLADGPLVYWRMGQKTGATVPDATGGGNALSLVGGFVPGVPGAIAGDADSAVRFDGSTSSASASNPRALDFGGGAPFSIEAWVRGDAAGGGSAYQHIVGNMDNGGNTTQRNGYYLFDTEVTAGSHRVVAELDPFGTQNQALGNTAAGGVWAHHVATFDGTTLTIYFDGAPQDSTLVTGGAITARSTAFTVGAEPGVGNFYFGDLDEIAVYGRALDAKTIARHYARGTGR